MDSPIVILTFFRYKNLPDKFWAFTMMQFAHQMIKDIPGLRFYKLLGSGAGNGFKMYANFAVYALLSVWDNQNKADEFINNSILFQKYRSNATEIWSVYLIPIRSHGSWSGINPFKTEQVLNEHVAPVAVITRATIKPRLLPAFWRQVPETSKILSQQEGLIASFGIGEWPVVQMATFSIWKSEDDIKKYAYDSREHLEAIKKTRKLNWYSEELFARFKPYRSEGIWNGKDPLGDYL